MLDSFSASGVSVESIYGYDLSFVKPVLHDNLIHMVWIFFRYPLHYLLDDLFAVHRPQEVGYVPNRCTVAEALERGIRPVRPVTGIVDDEGVNGVQVFQGFKRVRF